MSTENNQLLEIYKLHVEMIDRVTQRRGALNKFYITLLSVLLSVIAFTAELKFDLDERVIFISIAILGISACVLWIVKLHSYKLLNSAKFKVINEIEKQLQFDFYNREWKILVEELNYSKLTFLEKIAPGILMFPFILIFILGIIK